MSGARLFLLGLLAITAMVIAVPAASAKKTKPAPKTHAYDAIFTGTGDWNSTEVDAVEGVGNCANATDQVIETDKLKWDTKYAFTVPATGKKTVDDRGIAGYFIGEEGSWKQDSTITPSSCTPSSEDCTGDVWQASANHPPSAGWDKKPLGLIDMDDKYVTLSISGALGFVVADATGDTGCSLYSHYHEALEPFALGVHFGGSGSVQNVFSVLALAERKKFAAGKEFSIDVSPDHFGSRAALPPSACLPYTIDAISCTEQLSWSGKIKFSPLT